MDKLRKEIDQVDKKIVILLGNRMRLAKEIGEIKKTKNIPVRDNEREKVVLNKISFMAEETDLRKEFINDLYIQIMREAAVIQEKL